MFPCLRGVSVHSLNVPIEFSTVRDYVAWNLGKKGKLLAGNKLYRATFQASVFLCFNPQMLIYLTEYYLYNGAEMVSTPRIPPLHQRMWGKAYKNVIFIPTFLTQTQDIWCLKLSVLPFTMSYLVHPECLLRIKRVCSNQVMLIKCTWLIAHQQVRLELSDVC